MANNRIKKITADTVITDKGGTFEGFIWHMAATGTPNTYIEVFDDTTTSTPSNQIGKFHTTGTPPPAGNDFRGFSTVCVNGLVVTASDWTDLEVYVIYC